MRREDDEEKVAALLGGVGRIEAPAGFEQRVMRRIAEGGEPSVRRPAIMLALKFAAPAAVLLLMGTLFVFFGDREMDSALVPPVSDGQLVPAALDVPTEPAATPASSEQAQLKTPAANTAKPNEKPAGSATEITSEDFTAKAPDEPIRIPGIDTRPMEVDRSAVAPRGDGVKIGEVLSMLGVTSSCGRDGCRVTAVSPGSLAARGNLSAGDMIVSIDGRAVNSSTVFAGPTSMRTVQIVRGGQSVTIPLGAN